MALICSRSTPSSPVLILELIEPMALLEALLAVSATLLMPRPSELSVSSKPADPRPPLRCDCLGGGAEPKPTYLPPCEGATPSGREAFSACLRAKNSPLRDALAVSCC